MFFTKNLKKNEHVFDHFWPFFCNIFIFDLCILKFVFKRSIWLQRKKLEARFWAPNSTFNFSFFRTSARNFERSVEILKVRSEFWAFDWNFERSQAPISTFPENPGIFFHNIWYFWPRNMNIHIPRIKFASTRNSWSPLLGPKLHFNFPQKIPEKISQMPSPWTAIWRQ